MESSTRVWVAPLAVFVAFVPACGAARPAARAAVAPAPPVASTTAAPSAPSAAPAPAADAHTLSRSAVRAVVAQGLGAFLQRVELDDQPVRAGGKFHGFRIEQLRGAGFWQGVDLKPGDVVTSVNGFPIERPEEALTAFESLDVASELRVAYDRDGQPREIAYGIVEDR
jgi:type II secretory pathway component PulC